MRDTIFNGIVTMLQTLSIFKGEDGTARVYDFPITSPAGYPYVVVGSDSLESTVLDNARDTRRYKYRVQVVGEKFGEEGGMTQSDALRAMRQTEDLVLALFDAQNALGISFVVRSMPTEASYGTTDGGARIVWTMDLSVDTAVNITL